ncbi:acyltransferase family protein [Pseudomonas guariconensis]|uniref:acyltransferase family protein n=1 Tax=Pseudomonas guariconensis TaxID=1288410 RepID=UPI0034D669CF
MKIEQVEGLNKKAMGLSYPNYRPDIDGLRAVAVLLVVGYHAFPYWLAGGFIGVDIFFVISGYLISTIVLNGLQSGGFSFLYFFGRRVKRIFPALLLVLIVSFAFGWFALLADEYKQLGKHIAGGAGFVSNFVLWGENGYFDGAADTKPLLHLWSLGVEEQFYIVWPLLLWAAWKNKLNLLTVATIGALLSFVININQTHSDVVGAFYLPHSRFWELLVGSILACLTLHKPRVLVSLRLKVDIWLGALIYAKSPDADGRTLSNVQSMIGISLIAVGVSMITKDQAFPGWWALLPVMGALLIISAGPSAWINRLILSNRLLVWFGLISFPLYLWHWPILTFLRIVEGQMPSRDLRVAAVVLSVLLAWLTYRFIERPVRSGNAARGKIGVLLVLMVAIGYVGYNTYSRDGLTFRENIRYMNRVSGEFVGPLWRFTKNEACMQRYPLKGTERYGWWFCMLEKEENPSLLLLGTSHANELYAGFSLNSKFSHLNVLSIGTCDAAWIDETKSIDAIPGYEYSPCVGFRHADQQKLIDGVIRSGSLKFVIIAGLAKEITDDYIARLKKRIDFIEKNNIKVIIFTPHVSIDYDIKSCFSRPFSVAANNCRVSVGEKDKVLERIKPLVDSLAKSNPNVLFFDQNQLFCSASECSMIREGMPLLRDMYSHMSEYGSVVLSNMFAEWAKKNVPEMIVGNASE